ncbi:MAG: hypothetical protein H0T75_11090 [Rhizobiales bacterium]|nr:hypothetical protein [Hyphomicrobiales bacterium]
MLIYDTKADEMAVHAGTKGEIKLYLTCLGDRLFGDPGYFPAGDKFTLQPLVEKGQESLLCEDIDGLEAIRLVELRQFWGGAEKEMEIRKASDLFSALGRRGAALGPGGRLVAAAFKLKFAGFPKERSVLIRPPANARYERNEDSEIVELWLQRRGFTLPPAVSVTNDEEAPSAVLEVA